MKTVDEIRSAIREIADAYDLQIIYAFGSRAAEARDFAEGKVKALSPGPSDLDIGIKPGRRLTVEEKVNVGILLEDVFGASRVDVVVLPEAPVFLALRVVIGEILYARDLTAEAEYQLRILRMAADLEPHEKEMTRLSMGS